LNDTATATSANGNIKFNWTPLH